MSTNAARREYLAAIAEFQQALRDFSAGMGHVLDQAPTDDAARAGEVTALFREAMGPRKAAKRAPRIERTARVRKA